MSKPIKLTEDLKRDALKEFEKALSCMKMSDGKVTYTKNFTYSPKNEDKAIIYLTPLAYTKMIKLIMSFDSEIAWHGVGRRIEDAKFLISDILVYPQTVTGSTVEMDTEEYTKWLITNIDDDRFNNIIMQGHSHVNFSTTPSAIDTKHQDDILSQLADDMYYIFMIWNKRLEHTTKIYDLTNNTMYENKDISYAITGEDFDTDAFAEEARKLVKKKTIPTASNVAPYGGYYGKYDGNIYNASQQNAAYNDKIAQRQKGKAEIGNGWRGRGTEDMDEKADGYYKK